MGSVKFPAYAERDPSLPANMISDSDQAPIICLRRFIGSKLRGHADTQLLLAPVETLTAVFVADLQRLATDRPLALFFDTYERTAPILDGWLRELVDGRYGDLPANLTITIAGQHGLDANLWSDYLSELEQMPLTPFSEAEARDPLAQHDVTDQRVVEVILDLSGRLPLLLAMLAEGKPLCPNAHASTWTSVRSNLPRHGRYEEALADLNRAIELDHDDVYALTTCMPWPHAEVRTA